MELSVFLDQILFVIVLYKQKPGESPAYRALQTLTNTRNYPLSLFIYDNSPEPAKINSASVIYRHDRENNGVSKAYNEGFAVATSLNKKWMLLLDQDTCPEEHFIMKLPEAIQQNSGSMAFVPILVDEHSSVSPFRWSFGKRNTYCYCYREIAA